MYPPPPPRVGAPDVVYVLLGGQLAADGAGAPHLEVFDALEAAQEFVFAVQPMLPRDRYTWARTDHDAQRWVLTDTATLAAPYAVVARRLIPAYRVGTGTGPAREGD